MPTSGPAWYCARTKPKHEHSAAVSLARLYGFEVFHPRLNLERVTRRGKVRSSEPLFPCYIFVRCPSAGDLDEIRYATGISSLVQFGHDIAPVPDPVIEELRHCFETEKSRSSRDRLQAGTKVTVSVGQILGSQGMVVRVVPASQRAQILLDFLGRNTMAEAERKAFALKPQRIADLMPALFAAH